MDHEERAKAYASEAAQIFKEHSLDPPAQALLLASLAQVEATLAILERLKEGTFIKGTEELKMAMNRLAGKLPDR